MSMSASLHGSFITTGEAHDGTESFPNDPYVSLNIASGVEEVTLYPRDVASLRALSNEASKMADVLEAKLAKAAVA